MLFVEVMCVYVSVYSAIDENVYHDMLVCDSTPCKCEILDIFEELPESLEAA